MRRQRTHTDQGSGLPSGLPDAHDLERCTILDRRRLAGRIRRLSRSRSDAARRAETDEIRAAYRAAVDRRAARAASVPRVRLPDDLPVAQAAGEIEDAIREHQVTVLCGETGSGKTTQLPKICLHLGRGIDGMIGHTQPRRIAARSVAARIAEELERPLGETVGYKVRFGDQTGETTLVKLMTDGILLAETQGDPLLHRYDTIIVDEAHERSLNIDFLLGYLTTILPKRPDLKVIITSATIDPQRFADHFEKHLHAKVPVLMVEGRTYPVEVRYRDPWSTLEAASGEGKPIETSEIPDPATAAVDVIEEINRDHPPHAGGDILVFMPGEREIRETAHQLRNRYGHDGPLEILPLYARLSTEEQRRVFKPGGKCRVVIATNVAETSITVPGIKYVVDPGLARVSRYSARSRIQGLPIEPISKASANQRKGRCGRVGPGVCYRLYSEQDFDAREEFTAPEIMRTDLAGVVLQMAALKLGRPERFPFVEPPDPRLIRDGYTTLAELGAVDDQNRLSDIGRDMARLPIDPRTARMLFAGDREGCLGEMLILSTGLSIQDPRERPADLRDAADSAHEQFAHPTSDFMGLLNLWHFYHDHVRPLSRSKRVKACRQNFLSDKRLNEWRELQAQVRGMLREMKLRVNTKPAGEDAIHRALLAGLVTNIGHRADGYEYSGTRGNKFHIHPGSGVFKEKPKWIMAAELVRTTRLFARCVARIDPAWVEGIAPHLIKKNYTDPFWDAPSAKVNVTERVSLLGLDLVQRRRVNFGTVDPVEARRMFIHHALIEHEFDTKAKAIRHNRELEQEIKALESKARRRDLLAEYEARFAFYDTRLPSDVWSGLTFHRWLRRLEKAEKKTLLMRREDLILTHANAPGPEGDGRSGFAEWYPDQVSIGETVLPVEYRFEPGHERDGVTMDVPVEVLGQLSEDFADRVVPGVLAEKIEALIRTLPRRFRRTFDAEAVAAQIAHELRRPDEPLISALAGRLSNLAGVTVAPADLRPDALPDYLRLNIRVLDESGEVIAESRELAQLKRDLKDQIAHGFRRIASASERWNRDGITEWDFGDLPDEVEFESGGMTVHGFPAIVDQGRSAGLRLVDSAHAAETATRQGLTRLLVGRLKSDLRYDKRAIPGFDTLALHFAPLGSPADLTDQVLRLLADRVYLADERMPRTFADYTARLDQGWNRLSAATAEVLPLVDQILPKITEAAGMIRSDAPPAQHHAIADLADQLNHLFGKRFLTETPFRWLRCYPRYLKAIQTRFGRLRGGGADRDRRATAEVRRFWVMYTERAERHDSAGIVDPELEQFRWMVEEYRVATFAQELKTAVTVSPTRLERQFDRVRA